MQIIETIKAHKGLAAGVAVGAIVLVLALRASSGGTVANSTDPTGDVATGDALAQAQLQSQNDIALAGINAQAAGAHDSASLAATQLAADVQNNSANIAGNVALANINASLQALTNHDTLAASVANHSSDAQVQITGITTKAATDQMGLLTGVIINQNNNATAVGLAAINKQCSGFFDCL